MDPICRQLIRLTRQLILQQPTLHMVRLIRQQPTLATRHLIRRRMLHHQLMQHLVSNKQSHYNIYFLYNSHFLTTYFHGAVGIKFTNNF